MHALIQRFARNPVAANLLMLFLVVGGAYAALRNRVELFPEFSLDMITVRVVMPGAAPEEVEESVCVPVEEAVYDVQGVKRVRSTASEGLGLVTVEVRKGASADDVLRDVKTRVDAIDTFPESAEKPVIEDVLLKNLVTNVAVFGDVDEALLTRVAEEVRDEIADLDGISQVDLVSVRPYEISIELSEEEMQRHGLTFDEVAAAIRRSSLDLSGGILRTDRGEVLLRTKAQAYVAEDFENLVVKSPPDGARVLLGDVAHVVDGFEDVDRETLFDGEPSAMVQVYRVGDESALGVARAVREYVERKSLDLPDGVHLKVWQDISRMLSDRLSLMLRNGVQGFVLVFLVLALFLRFRLSVWVALGIPVSFLGSMMVLPLIGVSINMLSLLAFILVLGIVVDDAIIVGEAVTTEQEQGRRGVDAALRGALRVSTPVVFAVLTTVVAFVPLTAVPGILGKFFAVIPFAVIPTLLFSLLEAQLILPAHLAHQSAFLDRVSAVAPFRWWTAFRELIGAALTWWIHRVYRPSLELALRYRYATAAAAIALLLLTAGFVRGGFVKTAFMPQIEGDIVSARLEMPLGVPVEATARAVAQLTDAIEAVRADVEAEHGKVFKGVMTAVGEQPFNANKRRFEGGLASSSANLGEVTVELYPAEDRTITTAEIQRRWRERCGQIPGAVELAFDASLMNTGDALDVRFAGRDIDELRAAADELKGALGEVEGVFDVGDSFRGGRDELVVDVKPSAEALGLSRLDLARQVRQGFYGDEAQRVQRGRHEVKVMVRYPEEDRRSLYGVETMRVRTPSGGEVPFGAVASVDLKRGYATIQRSDRKRTIDVTADVDLERANPTEIQRALEAGVLPGILARHRGVAYSVEGERQEQADMQAALARTFVLALLAIFALMAVPFRSYVQPLIVMTAIPFGLVGAVLGHVVMGVELSALSLCGLAALAGVVVNDSLVMVDFVNGERADGKPLFEAIRAAGVQRFRPILLTSLTTFAGLTPLLLEKSVQAQFLIPMAISLAFGVMFSTLITLILVPAVYLILEDARAALRWLFGSRPVAARSVGDSPA